MVKEFGLFSSRRFVPSLLTGAALAMCVLIPSAEAASFVTERIALGANDRLDWSSVGPVFSAFGPPDPAVFLPSSFTAVSEGGRAVQVNIPPTTTPGVFPPFVFQTSDPGFPTNFGDGDFILFTGLLPGPPPAPGNPGPITLSFAEPVAGAGAQLAVDDIFDFTATISAFDENDQLIDSFSTPGTSSVVLDNSAVFLSIADDGARIAKLQFSASVPTSAIGINQLSLLTARSADVPEPSLLIGLGVLVGLGFQRKRFTADRD